MRFFEQYCFDEKIREFYPKDDEENLKKFLRSLSGDICNFFQSELLNNINEEKLIDTEIVFDLDNRPRLLETSELINKIRSLRHFFNNELKECEIIDNIIEHQHNNEKEIESSIKELDSICENLLNERKDNQQKEDNKATYNAEKKIRKYIRDWETKILGTFNEETSKITLYLMNICDSKHPNIGLIATYVHELFHALHYYSSNNYFFTEWLDRDTDKFVKEGIARYLEIEYIRRRVNDINKAKANQCINEEEAKQYINELEESMLDNDIKNNPYATYKIFNADGWFLIEVFEISLEDIGDAYNLLIYRYYCKSDRKKEIENKISKIKESHTHEPSFDLN